MASTFEKTSPVVRDTDIEGYPVRITMDATGITFRRKGDRSRVKAEIVVPWGVIAEVGAEKVGVNFYTQLGFDKGAAEESADVAGAE